MCFYMRTGTLTESMTVANRLSTSGQLFKRDISQNFLVFVISPFILIIVSTTGQNYNDFANKDSLPMHQNPTVVFLP